MKLSDIEHAFLWVSADHPSSNHAYLCKETGRIYYTSDLMDTDEEELPEDIDNEDRYLSIPHQHDLDLGRNLVFDFAEQFLLDDLDAVYVIFRKKGAYAKFKALLERRSLLDKWYAYENERQEHALREWCRENGIDITD